MQPVSPVLPGRHFHEAKIAEKQSEYVTLPALVGIDENGIVTTRWKLTLFERLALLISGNLFLQVLTFRKPLQPVKLSVLAPDPVQCGVTEPAPPPVLGGHGTDPLV